MTQDEIKEALETCILGYCTGCPYDGCDGDCRDELHKDVLTLITEQEQIEKMARSMCGYCSTDGKCAVSKNGREPDICANVDTEHCLYKEYAERLIESGYGDVSEYKAEIERLRQEVRDTDKMARNTIEQYRAENEELENALKQSDDNYSRAFERLKAQEREIGKLKDENEALKNDLINSEGNLNHITTEFEQLKAENATLYEARNNLLEENDKLLKDNVALILDKKQAQIDVLNKAKEKFNAISRELGDDCDLCGVSAVCSCRCEINNLIKEIENEQKD